MVRADHTGVGEWRRDLVARASGTVLEIAAGTGLDFPYYQPETFVVATEVDEDMLRRAGARAEQSSARIMLVVADAQALPFRDGAFDSAVVGLAMCTIPSPAHALGELRRVVRVNGKVHMLEHVRAASHFGGRLQDWLTPLWRRVAGGCRLNEPTVERVRTAGFRIDGLRRHVRGLFVEIDATNPTRVAD